MPQITVLYWNVQNFGNTPLYKTSYVPLCQFIAVVARLMEADVICIQEVNQGAVASHHLQALQQALNTVPLAPHNNWYYDLVKGSIRSGGAVVPPYATSNDLDWDAAHHEGYALFWNQNLAKFRVMPAPPITPPGGMPVANTQSETSRGVGRVILGGANVPVWGLGVPAGGIVVPPNPAYTLPAGTTAPAGAAINDGAAVVVAAGAVLAAAANVNGGTVLPLGTVIGAGGVELTAPLLNLNPVVVPGGFTLTEPLTLPPPGTVVVPEHVASLVITGRDTRGGGAAPATYVGDIAPATAPFVPAAGHAWQYLAFTRGATQPASIRGTRRPAFLTLNVNIAGAPGPAQQLVPVIVYHAPAAAPASSAGMQRAAYSQPLYQAYDPGAAAWIDNNHAVLGGDMNVRLDGVAFAHTAFTSGFAAGGANCTVGVSNPAPAPTAAKPAPTRADNPLNKTTAQTTRPPVNGVPVVSAATDDYRMLAIDNVFHRGFAPGMAAPGAQAGVYDLLLAVTGALGAGNIPAPVLQAFAASVNVLAQNLAVAMGGMGPAPPTPGIIDAAELVTDLAGGQVGAAAGVATTPARRAAEFVHLCVSDHLPVGVRLYL